MGYITINELSDSLVQYLNDLTKMSNGNTTSRCVDNNTDECSSAGSLVNDAYSSNGQVYMLKSNGSVNNVYTGQFNNMKFGNYSLCMRIKISDNSSASTVLTASIKNGGTTLLSKQIAGNVFKTASDYCYLYTTFEYEGSNNGALTFELNTASVSGVDIYFDYAYISLITPAIYI